MNMELSRRQFMHGAGAGIAGTTLGALGFGDLESAYPEFHSSEETREPDRDPQYLSLLFGRLRRQCRHMHRHAASDLPIHIDQRKRRFSFFGGLSPPT